MPDCDPEELRQLLLEASGLKFKDPLTGSKLDVHCLLFTDLLLICRPHNRRATDRLRIIRQPFLVDRLRAHELRDQTGLVFVYLNELNVASAYFVLHTSEPKVWMQQLCKAQQLYSTAKERALALLNQQLRNDQPKASTDTTLSTATSIVVPCSTGPVNASAVHQPTISTVGQQLLGNAPLSGTTMIGASGAPIWFDTCVRSTFSSSRSSLVRSHSNSFEISDASALGSCGSLQAPPSTPNPFRSSASRTSISPSGSMLAPQLKTPPLATLPSATGGSTQAAVHCRHGANKPDSQLLTTLQPSRAISFELGELRNPSITVDDLDCLGRSHSMENRCSPPYMPAASPRPERRAFLLKGAGGQGRRSGSNETMPNSGDSGESIGAKAGFEPETVATTPRKVLLQPTISFECPLIDPGKLHPFMAEAGVNYGGLGTSSDEGLSSQFVEQPIPYTTQTAVSTVQVKETRGQSPNLLPDLLPPSSAIESADDLGECAIQLSVPVLANVLMTSRTPDSAAGVCSQSKTQKLFRSPAHHPPPIHPPPHKTQSFPSSPSWTGSKPPLIKMKPLASHPTEHQTSRASLPSPNFGSTITTTTSQINQSERSQPVAPFSATSAPNPTPPPVPARTSIHHSPTVGSPSLLRTQIPALVIENNDETVETMISIRLDEQDATGNAPTFRIIQEQRGSASPSPGSRSPSHASRSNSVTR